MPLSVIQFSSSTALIRPVSVVPDLRSKRAAARDVKLIAGVGVDRRAFADNAGILRLALTEFDPGVDREIMSAETQGTVVRDANVVVLCSVEGIGTLAVSEAIEGERCSVYGSVMSVASCILCISVEGIEGNWLLSCKL